MSSARSPVERGARTKLRGVEGAAVVHEVAAEAAAEVAVEGGVGAAKQAAVVPSGAAVAIAARGRGETNRHWQSHRAATSEAEGGSTVRCRRKTPALLQEPIPRK